jgi:hypothetical protein
LLLVAATAPLAGNTSVDAASNAIASKFLLIVTFQYFLGIVEWKQFIHIHLRIFREGTVV